MIEVVAGVIKRRDSVLLASRPIDKPPAGWEFPGGKIEIGETPQKALKRELREELSIDVTPGDEIYMIKTDKIKLHFVRAFLSNEEIPIPKEGQSWAWVTLTTQVPDKLLHNDWIFWKFLTNN